MDTAKRIAMTVLLSSACGIAAAGSVPGDVPFVPNRGQGHPDVAFDGRTSMGPLFVTHRGELVQVLHGRDAAWSLSESFVGGSASPRGAESAGARVSYFLAPGPAGGTESLPTYRRLHMPDVWKGVDVSLCWNAGSVEKVFKVAPGSSPEAIRMRIRGAENLRRSGDGSLVVTTGIGDVSFSRPVAYQPNGSGSGRDTVDVEYAVSGSEYGFRLGFYDAGRPLVIDPVLQSTFLGGTSFEGFAKLAIDPTSGDVYATGTTGSSNFPGVAGGAQPVFAGNNDIFVARLNSSLTSLIQATYFGGSGIEFPTGIELSPSDGSVYVAGYTNSTTLPGTAGSAQPVGAAFDDAFVARFSPSLTTLHRATFLGGTATDRAFAMRLHPSTGDVYIAGYTASGDLPGRSGGAQPIYAGGSDAFVSRLDPALATIVQSTYFGGGSADEAWALAFGIGGSEVFLAGITSGGLPGTTGGAQPVFGGATDAFVARFGSSLMSLGQATYLGGGAFDNGYALVVDRATGDVFAAGSAASLNFPGVAGGARPNYAGGAADAFLSRLNPTLTMLRQSTFFGGSGGIENALAIGIHPSGPVYITGATDSADLPGTAGAAQSASGGFLDAYLARFDPTLRTLQQATYLGASRYDHAEDLVIGPAGDIYVVGTTDSFDFPRTAGGAQPVYGGVQGSGIPDAFVSRISPGLEGGPSEPIPTLSPWSMAILAILLVAGAITVLRFRF